MGTRTAPTIERQAQPGALCEAIVAAARELDDVDVRARDPLHDAVDVDALTAIFSGRTDTEGHTTFTWADCDVTVYSDRRVEVTPCSAEHSPR